MFTLKQSNLEYCDYIVTESPFGTANDVLVEKHLESGALLVKVATEKDMPVFADTDNSNYLTYLLQMQRRGASRKQCVLLIIGDYSEFSAEMSANWQLLGGVCILLNDEKRMQKTLIDLASFPQNTLDDLLIALPYFSYDLVSQYRNGEFVFPFLLQLLAAIDNGEALESFGISANKAAKIRDKMGIPENIVAFGYRHEPEE